MLRLFLCFFFNMKTSIHPSVCLSGRLSVRLPACPAVSLSVHACMNLTTSRQTRAAILVGHFLSTRLMMLPEHGSTALYRVDNDDPPPPPIYNIWQYEWYSLNWIPGGGNRAASSPFPSRNTPSPRPCPLLRHATAIIAERLCLSATPPPPSLLLRPPTLLRGTQLS